MIKTGKEEYEHRCQTCGQIFANSFEEVEHFLELGDTFNPAFILPNGYRLMLGTLLYQMYEHRNDPKYIDELSQSVYATLWTAETAPDVLTEEIEEAVVESAMETLDSELNKLFESGA